MRPELLAAASASGGVLSHLVHFIHGHRAMEAPKIVGFYIIAVCLLWARCIHLQGVVHGASTAGIISASYFLGLFASILTYRIFFHRLRRFPGPIAAKITKLYGPYKALDGKSHLHWSKLFDKYGDIIRIGPNELMALSLDAQQKVHGAGSPCSKRDSPYESIGFNGHPNLDTILNHKDHRWRRQIWDKAFSTKSLETYERNAREVVYEWLEKLESLQGQSINTSLYSTLIPFENMGRMGFSTSFGSIKAGKEDPMLHYLETTLGTLAKLGLVWWPIALMNAIGGSHDHIEFQKLACKMVDRRGEVGSAIRYFCVTFFKSDFLTLAQQADDEHEDIMKYFLEDYHSKEPKTMHHINDLYSDAQAVMTGGTDTIAVALAFAFYHIARDPTVQNKLRSELQSLFGRTVPGEFNNHDLGEAEAPYLNALINETMRLDNPTCANGPRMTPPEGLEVDGIFIPGETLLFVPIHSMHTSARYFKEPNSFIPERWTTRPDLVIDKRAFHPFLLGPYNCVGKKLALIVLRFTIAYTVWNYDFKFAPGEDGTSIHQDMVNQAILKAGGLQCVFTKRD